MVSCTKGNQENKKSLLINGAGASFPYILYSKWLSEYRKTDSSVKVNYQSIGSSGGIRQFLNGTLDFGATDVYVSKKELKKAGKEIFHIPTALGAVAVAYNVKIGAKALRLDRSTLTKIFMGEVTKWNDPAISKLNSHLNLPDKAIVVVYRADGSGTTALYTEYLAKESQFLNKVGRGKSVSWPVGVGGKGNEGVMGLVSKIEGSIGYISLSYALSQKIPVIELKNKSGNYVAPSTQSIKAAANHTVSVHKTFSASLIDAGGKGSYPISGFTYIIISPKMPKIKGEQIVKFLKWCISDGQKFAEPLHFIPIPQSVVKSNLKTLSKVRYE